jgi:hypothetical protein
MEEQENQEGGRSDVVITQVIKDNNYSNGIAKKNKRFDFKKRINSSSRNNSELSSLNASADLIVIEKARIINFE